MIQPITIQQGISVFFPLLLASILKNILTFFPKSKLRMVHTLLGEKIRIAISCSDQLKTHMVQCMSQHRKSKKSSYFSKRHNSATFLISQLVKAHEYISETSYLAYRTEYADPKFR